ncbi:hypothetical protein AB0F81_29480 [Actinoplanes sp. NPDC024001]|uniref:hypothetical protein n=1 Tax=Actinoplanes sp. NPDC024001 TaxID=3154598 RepID=UPI0033C5E485
MTQRMRAPSEIRWLTASRLSVLVAVLAGASSLIGLLVDGVYVGPASVAEMLRGFDLVTLVVVAPVLAWTQSRGRRGSVLARLLQLGMLAYLVYTYAYYLFGVSFNDVFLLHVAVFMAAVLALAGTVLAVGIPSADAVVARRTPRRLVSAVLGLLAVAMGGMWVFSSLRFAATGEVPAGSMLVEPDLLVHLGIVLDLVLLVPFYALASALLWRGTAAGFVLAAVALISGTLHQVSYMVALWFQAAASVPGAVAFDPVEPVIAALFLVPAVLLLWEVRRRSER